MVAADTGPGLIEFMLKRFQLLLLSIALLAGATVPAVALADRYHPQVLARRGGEDRSVSLSEAVRRVQHDTGGRVLSAETVGQGSRRVHRIKVLLPSGRVRVVTVDAGR